MAVTLLRNATGVLALAGKIQRAESLRGFRYYVAREE
jgi:hypothetical protein